MAKSAFDYYKKPFYKDWLAWVWIIWLLIAVSTGKMEIKNGIDVFLVFVVGGYFTLSILGLVRHFFRNLANGGGKVCSCGQRNRKNATSCSICRTLL